MKIMHVMLACFYIDKYSYQENLLPKYHKLQEHDVRILASLFTFDENGNGIWLPSAAKYINEDGIQVLRLDFAKGKTAKRLRRYVGLKSELDSFAPDIIFIHGVQFLDIDIIANYAKNNTNVVIYVDNHADFSNSAKRLVSKHIQHKIIWRHCAQMIAPYTKKFYGVLPARVDFLISVYKISPNKVELLVMGADDVLVKEAKKKEKIVEIREKYGISKDDFLIVYGGKTDNYKKQVIMLMDAVNKIDNPKLKLLVFGSVIPELKEELIQRCSDKVKYIGWILAKDSYQYFAAADLVCFPGRHSVFWEQVVAQEIPLLVKKWDGTTHVDCGGNAKFLYSDSVTEIKDAICEITDETVYKSMKDAAVRASSHFMYSSIAKRSICE